MEVINPNLMFFPAAGLRVSFAITGRTCSRTDAVRPHAPGRRSNQLRHLCRTPEDGRGGEEHGVPLGDVTNTHNRKNGSKKRSRDLESGE